MDLIDFAASCVRQISCLKTTLYQSSFKMFIIYIKITYFFFGGGGDKLWFIKKKQTKQKHLNFFLPGGRKKSGSGAPVSECVDAWKTNNTKSTYMQCINNMYTFARIEQNSAKYGNS